MRHPTPQPQQTNAAPNRWSARKNHPMHFSQPLLNAMALLLFTVVTVPLAIAHDSVKEVENQIQQQEHYAQLTSQPAQTFILEDTLGRKVTLEDFQGKVVILNFIYARCKEVCPLHSHKLAAVQQQLTVASLADRVQFVTIATDTEDAQQTATVMREHGSKYGLDRANWVFLYGGPGREGVGLAIARTYGLKFTLTGTGEQMHGVVTHLIDAKGRLRARYHGLKFNPVNLTLHAAALVNGVHHAGNANVAQPREGATAARPVNKGGGWALGHWLLPAIGMLGLVVLLFAGRELILTRSTRHYARTPSNSQALIEDSEHKPL